MDEAEFRKVQKKLEWRNENGQLFSLMELPVPCHRLPRAYLDEILQTYAGITTADMHTDWEEEALYIPETDCFIPSPVTRERRCSIPFTGREPEKL